MELEVVTIGNELLLGFTLDSNAADLSRGRAPGSETVWLRHHERWVGTHP
jgi:hypothetical protein